jgi:transposase InsO family protein
LNAVTVDRHEITSIPQNIHVTHTSMHHAASTHAVPPDAQCNDIDMDSNKDTHIHDIHAAHMVLMDDTHCNDNVSDMKHDHMNSDNWSPCIVLNGCVNECDARILFDPGAESNFISRGYMNVNDIHSIQCNNGCNGVMADGSTQLLNEIVSDINIRIQTYVGTVNLYVLDIPHYDIILGVPFHELHDAVTYHYKREIHLHHEGTLHVLKQHRHSLHALRTSISISATQVMRMMKPKTQRDAHGNKIKIPPPQMYIMMIVNKNADNTDASTHSDEHKDYFLKQYPDVCGDIPAGLPPQRPDFDHHIDIEEGAKPPNQPAYRESASNLDELKRQIDELLELKFIRLSNSPYASPVLFVKKHDGTWRMCIDYRALNKITIKNRYPLPHTDDLIDRLHSATHLTKLDLRSGYHQVRMADDSISKTAFITRYGLYEFLVMPFGLCNAPSTFMKLMNEVLRQLLDKCVIVFIDDILVYSTSEEQHYKDVSAVFDILRENKLYIKLSKCDFFKSEVEFLGHVVGNGMIKMSSDKMNTIMKWPPLKTISDVRSFIGLCNYYRKFIKGFSQLAAPLTDLLKDGRDIIWSSTQQIAFDRLKMAVSSSPVLMLPDHTKPWILFTDASGYGVGGALCQNHGAGPQPVVFISHKLSKSQMHWPIHDKEMYAVVYCFKSCRWYLQDRDVTVYTDHKSLEYFQTQKLLSPRQLRWNEFMASYAWKIVYRPGKYNNVADALSRRPDLQNDNEQFHDVNHSNHFDIDAINIIYICGITSVNIGNEFIDEVKHAYNDDDICKTLLERNGNHSYTVLNGMIYKGDRIYIPVFQGLKQKLLYEYHDAQAASHRGIASTHDRLMRHYYWPNMYNDVEVYVQQCTVCQQAKSMNQTAHALLQPLPIPEKKFNDISMDFITKLPKTLAGNDSILVIVDRLTKYAMFIAMKSAKNEDVPAALITAELFVKHWIRQFSTPISIVSDRDTQFTSKFWKRTFELLGTKLKYSTAYHPQTDGQTERTNRTLEEMLRCYIDKQHDNWDELLLQAEIAYNSVKHSSTQYTPYSLVYGEERRHPADIMSDQVSAAHAPAADKFVRSMNDMIESAKQHLLKAQKKYAKYADHHRRVIEFDVGQYVWISTEHLRQQGECASKLKHKYAGPFKILKRINNTAYELQLPANSKMHPVVNVSRLRRFNPRLNRFADDEGNDIEPPPDLIDEEEEYEVDRLLKYDDEAKQFLVKWKGWANYHNTWEDRSMLQRNAAEMIDEYFAKHKEKPVASNDNTLSDRSIRAMRRARHLKSLPMMISVNNMFQQFPII